jgi:hypothetical protein
MKVREQRQRRVWRPRATGTPSTPPQLRFRRWSLNRRWTAFALAIMLAVAAGWLGISSQLRRPAEKVFIPEGDAYVSTAHPDTNYGTAPTLRTDATPRLHSFLRFRLQGLSGRVVRAQLRLWSPTGDLVGYSVHPVSAADWDERSITFRHHSTTGDAVARSGPFGPGSWSSVDVTRLVHGGIVSMALTTRSLQTITFDSREGTYKPQLLVQTVPASAPSSSESDSAVER